VITTNHSRIVLLESLPPSDRRTGRELSDDLQFYRSGRTVDVPIELLKVPGRTELFQTLDKLGVDAESGDSPIVHIECHGFDDRSGLSLADGTAIDWEELTAPFVRINVATRCTLLFSVAACFGAHAVAALARTSRAPFWAIVAPKEKITPSEIYGPYLRFYAELLTSGDGDRALNAMVQSASAPNLYGFMTCEQFFQVAFRRYLARSTMESARDAEIARARSYFAAFGLYPDEALVRKILEGFDDETFFSELFRRFIMADLYPENAQRFPLLFADVVQPAPPSSAGNA
jgi:hypothetical protein